MKYFWPLCALFLVACGRGESPAPSVAATPTTAASQHVPSESRPVPSATPAPMAASALPPQTQKPAEIPAIRFTSAGEGDDLKTTIRAARLRAVEAGRTFVVYVGASWCPPCKRFHEAISSGSLDEKLHGYDVLYLDMDVVKDKLIESGYASRYIPFFALARPDGSRGDSFEVKRTDGPALDEIVQKLSAFRGK